MIIICFIYHAITIKMECFRPRLRVEFGMSQLVLLNDKIHRIQSIRNNCLWFTVGAQVEV